ncbi:hypothetical protein [Sulfitobacter sp. JL08]|nr:hypothetical protein [Sulfitobacter sp. JL08]
MTSTIKPLRAKTALAELERRLAEAKAAGLVRAAAALRAEMRRIK